MIPQRNEHSFGHFMDLDMLVMTGGRERTAEEFGSLLKRGGFELQRVVPTESLLSVVEAKASDAESNGPGVAVVAPFPRIGA